MKAKKMALTSDKYLTETLVSEAEQPYEVPDNWIWVRLGNITTINPPKIPNEKLPKMVSFVPMAAVSDVSGVIVDAQERPSSVVSKGYTEFIENDIIFAKITPCMENGKVAIAKNLINNVGFGSTEFYVFRTQNCLLSNLLYHLLRAEWFRDEAKRNMAGAVGQQRVKKGFLVSYAFPLPPLPEQHRIVERIESLFEKLDHAKELTQSVLDSLKTRKAAILHKAFTGELTAKWREENGVGMESWEEKYFSDAAIIKSNLVNPKDYPEQPHIAPDNIEKRTGVLLDYNTISKDGVTSGKHRFFSGQILYSKIRPYLSKVVIVSFDGLCSADMYPIEAKGDNKYLWYYMLSDDFLEQTSNAGSRSLLPKINQKELSALTVPIPSITEQREIVHILDSLFEKEQRARGLCDVIEKINLMKKAILARAFRGELGTNDPGEENALGLLMDKSEREISSLL